MSVHLRTLPPVVCAVMVLSISSVAQTPDRRAPQDQAPNIAASTASIEQVAAEIGLLRKSVQTLNVKLSEITDKVFARDDSKSGSPNEQNRIVLNLDLLTRAEFRAEVLRKQFFELIEKETSLRVRLVQVEEDMRPENIERALNPYGTTRTTELRDTRRRALESERRGIESLLNQIAPSRGRLDEDVKQADSMVFRLRQRLLPQIDKEIEKINPN